MIFSLRGETGRSSPVRLFLSSLPSFFLSTLTFDFATMPPVPLFPPPPQGSVPAIRSEMKLVIFSVRALSTLRVCLRACVCVCVCVCVQLPIKAIACITDTDRFGLRDEEMGVSMNSMEKS